MKKTNGSLHLPALQAKMGDRGYIITAMRLGEIATRVKAVPDVHRSKKLRDMIQRQLIEEHADGIAEYLRNEESRFFNALVIGVYGGDPQWAELAVSDPRNELAPEEEDRLTRTVGVLVLTGHEKLFAIDGQHRVAGIKRAVEGEDALAAEEVTVILVGHARTEEGKKRTRRLFVTLNNPAEKVSARDIVALAEDNGLAVVTRRMIDDFNLFQQGEIISFSASVAIPEKDQRSITSILGLFQIVRALYPRTSHTWPKRTVVQRARPEDQQLDEIYTFNCRYWELLLRHVKEYRTTLVEKTKLCGYFRQPTRNHLLFRPAGQHAFARAVECMISRGLDLDAAISQLISGATMWLQDDFWHHILWDPVAKKMINNVSSAETRLLLEAGQEARTPAAQQRLDHLLHERDHERDSGS
jgi:DNA sulfur modification protein DndB